MTIDPVTPGINPNWEPGDTPETHPMWETQVELEFGMMREGAKRIQDNVVKAKRLEQMTRLEPVRGLLSDWLHPVAMALKGWLADIKKSRGARPVAYYLLEDMDPYVASMIGLRAILDGVAKQRLKAVGLAMQIGRLVEHEQKIRQWEALEPGLYNHYREDMDRNRSTATHRRRVNINRFNAILKEGNSKLHWVPWNQEQHFRVGIALLDIIMRYTGWFELETDPDHYRKGAGDAPQYVIVPSAGLTEWLGKAIEHREVTSPHYLPTVMPPKRWDGTRMGGYYTPYVKAPRLVRFKASQETQQERAADEYEALDMPNVYDAIHLLQETAWRVNKPVLEVALKAWPLSGFKEGVPEKLQGFAKLPEVGERPLPPRTPRMLEHREALREWKFNRATGAMPPQMDEALAKEIAQWKRKAAPIHRFNAKRLSKMRSTTSTIQVAQQYADYERIYFPHMLDFRGRIYPIANFLQPQGTDIARGLLTFADALPITEENGGAGWLAIQLATSWGNDKVPFEERIDWVFKQETMWREIVADPFDRQDWATADKPFQTLAAAYEWVGFLDHGYGFESRLPVMVDGTCNGIQHLSAIARDPVAGAYVNLIPGERPRDIYKVVGVGSEAALPESDKIEAFAQVVVEGLQARLERAERQGKVHATFWLDLCGRDIPRTLTKRPVMVLPYGGKMDAFFKYVREWLDENSPPPEPTENKEHDDAQRSIRNERVVFMAQHMMEACKEALGSAMKVMEWLQECAKVVAIANQPIYWTTPADFTVRHFYGLDRAVRHECLLDGHFVKLTRSEKTAKLSVKEQTQGIAPNFIHSLDAAALKLCLKKCREVGIEDFASVHDAYGTHAANMNPLAQFLREAFVEVHRHDVLGEFRAACQRVMVDALVVTEGMDPFEASQKADEMLPPPLERGTLDIEAVLSSPYFFA